MAQVESALVILVPEAEALVGRFRQRHNPAAPSVPAHVTVLYPFKPPTELTAAVLRELEALFADFPSFAISFADVRQFPGVVYLAPIPDDPIRRLTEAVARCFPETPPYGGEFTEVIPHLTVVHDDDPQRSGEIAADVQVVALRFLPMRIRVTEVTLLDNEHGPWQVRQRFALGPTAAGG